MKFVCCNIWPRHHFLPAAYAYCDLIERPLTGPQLKQTNIYDPKPSSIALVQEQFAHKKQGKYILH